MTTFQHLNLHGKTVLITGAGSCIGEACAKLFHALQADIQTGNSENC